MWTSSLLAAQESLSPPVVQHSRHSTSFDTVAVLQPALRRPLQLVVTQGLAEALTSALTPADVNGCCCMSQSCMAVYKFIVLTAAVVYSMAISRSSAFYHGCCIHTVIAAGAMSFEDGLKLVKLRGESMQAAADAAKSGMVSVIGLNKEKVAELCEAATKEVCGSCGL